jgi:hypothetical protein
MLQIACDLQIFLRWGRAAERTAARPGLSNLICFHAMRKPWRYVLAILAAIIALGWLWYYRMQYVALAFDTLATQQIEERDLPSVAWNDLYLVANGHVLDLDLPDKPSVSARIRAAPGGPLVLADKGERIVLGRRTSSVISNQETIKPATVFAREPGDRLFLSVERSWLEWPTFFMTNYMTGNSTTWRRYKYYRLTLRKASGLSVEMLWRYEEFYYPSDHAWINSDKLCETDEPACGLVRVRVDARG